MENAVAALETPRKPRFLKNATEVGGLAGETLSLLPVNPMAGFQNVNGYLGRRSPLTYGPFVLAKPLLNGAACLAYTVYDQEQAKHGIRQTKP